MLGQPKLGQLQKGTIAALLCFAFGIAVFDGLSSHRTPPAIQNSGDRHRGNGQKYNNDKKSESMTPDYWLALFTFGLVIVGGVQVLLFYVQLKFIRESLDDAKRAAKASADAAIATARQAKVAEDSLTKLERPYLFIFNVGNLEATEGIWEADGDIMLSVSYSVANYGKIPAIIKSAQAILGASGDDPPMPDRLHDGHSLVASPIFAAGEGRHKIEQHRVWNGDYGNNEDGEISPVLISGQSLFLWVIVAYRGPFTDGHETRQCWVYNESTSRFIPHGGPECTNQQ